MTTEKFFLDKNVLEIAKLCSKPLNIDTDDGDSRINTLIFFTPDGRCYFTNKYYFIEYLLPTASEVQKKAYPQLQLFAKNEEEKGFNLKRVVSVLGKEFVNSLVIKSEMPGAGNYAEIRESQNEKNVLEFFWNSGIADVRATHLNQDFEMPNLKSFIKDFEPDGSKILINSEYIRKLATIVTKIQKTRECVDDGVMIGVNNKKRQLLMSTGFVKVLVMGLKE